jgi:hypothetical protein
VAWWRPNAAAGGRGAWVVSWLPLRLLTKQQALAAMMLAETVSKGITPEDQQSIEKVGTRVGLTSPEAIAAVTQG